MAKKEEVNPTPIISQIPVPQSDSPLVIDLPDGQKLVVGNLATGTVIEVATWRGTGRPDSRTQRLMLGVSSSSEENQKSSNNSSAAEQSSATPTQSSSAGRFDVVLVPVMRVVFYLVNLFLPANKQIHVAPTVKKAKPVSSNSESNEFDPTKFEASTENQNKSSKFKIPSVKKFNNSLIKKDKNLPNSLSEEIDSAEHLSVTRNSGSENIDEWITRIVEKNSGKAPANKGNATKTRSNRSKSTASPKKSATNGKKAVKKSPSKR
jgi:hypothetical protein